MKTLKNIRETLEKEYPILSEMINGEEFILNTNDRAETLDRWAANLYNQELADQAIQDAENAKNSALEKLAALGLTENELNSLIK